jgi:heptosyltransferase-2
MAADYRNILVINLMHIGDLMLVTPVLRTLRTNYPSARLTLLADKKLRDLVEFNPHIDECLLIDKKGKDDHLGSFFRFIPACAKKNSIW